MKKVNFVLGLFLLLCSFHMTAQTKEKILAEGDSKDPFKDHFRWGLSFHQQWGIIKGTNLPKDYFAKPCLGFNLRAEYYFNSVVGVGGAFGIQQRGAGIKNIDRSGGAFSHPWDLPQNNGDSTYRERLRFNTWEIPVSLLLRTPKDIVKGLRITGSAGLVFYKVQWVKDIFLSVEDGYHTITDVSNDYLKSDVAYQFSLGADIDAGTSCVFQVHLTFTQGMRNIYKTGPGDGRLENYGVRVAWLF